MRKVIDYIAFPILPSETVAIAAINEARKVLAAGRRNHNGRFVKPYRVAK